MCDDKSCYVCDRLEHKYSMANSESFYKFTCHSCGVPVYFCTGCLCISMNNETFPGEDEWTCKICSRNLKIEEVLKK